MVKSGAIMMMTKAECHINDDSGCDYDDAHFLW